MNLTPELIAKKFRVIAMIDDVRVLAQMCDIESMEQFAMDAKRLSIKCEFSWRHNAPADPQ